MEHMPSLSDLFVRLLGFSVLFLIASAVCRPGSSSFSRLLAYFGKPARLLRAAEKGNAAAVQQLLAAGVDVNTADEQKSTPLLRASAQGHAAVVKLLLEHGADVAHQCFYYGTKVLGWNALTLAATHGHIECVKVLLEHGAKDIDDALGQALWSGHRDIALLLKEHGANVQSVANQTDRHGKSNLMGAAEEGRADTVRLLLEFGADANAVDELGKTALMEAAFAGDEDIIRMLLDAGAAINAADEDGKTALMRAAELVEDGGESQLAAVELLLAAGADAQATNKEGKTALDLARESGGADCPIARALEAAGAR